MLPTVILADGFSPYVHVSSIDELARLAAGAGLGDSVALVSQPSTSLKAAHSISNAISIGEAEFSLDQLLDASPAIANSGVLLLNPSIALDVATLSKLCTVIEETQTKSVVYLPIALEDGVVSLSVLKPDTLVEHILEKVHWPIACVYVPSEVFAFSQNQDRATCASGKELIVRLLISAHSCGISIKSADATVALRGETEPDLVCRLDLKDQARALRHAVTVFNIEELFTEYNWSEFENESAAAAFHSLAAMFLRLDEQESAIECLGMSDDLEDSPRSLALKAAISFKQGKSLDAVAQLVSSLQEYEKRKNATKEHYLSFPPTDIQTLNSSLQKGLEALNRKENDSAVTYFAEAIDNFDTFYREHGVRWRR